MENQNYSSNKYESSTKNCNDSVNSQNPIKKTQDTQNKKTQNAQSKKSQNAQNRTTSNYED